MSWIYIHGIHSVSQALIHHPDSIAQIWLSPTMQAQSAERIQCLAAESSLTVLAKPNQALQQKAGPHHQGVVAKRQMIQPAGVELIEDFCTRSKPVLLLALDGVQDPHNFGACLRVADAAGVDGVITPKNAAVAINATVHKASSGAAETVAWVQVSNMVRTLKRLQQAGIWVIGADQHGDKSLFEADVSGSVAVLMGGEGRGLRRLRRETCDQLVSIPMLGSVESLNVSVATGIILYQVRASSAALSSRHG